MREIKFRVWDKKENEMFYSNMYQNKTSMIYGLGNFLKECSDIEEPIMQFTGLKDKNGVEIYEGDIISCQNKVGQVKYEKSMFIVDFIKAKGHLFSVSDEYIVVGNIYKNPELLKKED